MRELLNICHGKLGKIMEMVIITGVPGGKPLEAE